MKSANVLGLILAVQVVGVVTIPVSIVLGDLILLCDTAVNNFGGNFNDLFGSLVSLSALAIDINENLVHTDLTASNFLLTGQDPCFNASRDVHFLLYTNQNIDGVNVSISNIAGSTYNSSNPTRFIIHGFVNGPFSAVNTEITQAYLVNGDFNVIVVDWSYGADDPNYLNARLRVNAVSIQIANFINSLISSNLTTHDLVTIVGHSLGAHTAGLTGKKITGGKVKAVIALDPAGPLFPTRPTKATVQSTDAQYVEAIHTNGGGLGMKHPCAQADFFPNGGSLQPGCVDLLACPHCRSYDYFAESINNDQFKAVKCASYSEISSGVCTDQGGVYNMGGEPSNSGISGVFALNTAGGSPFALG